MVRALVALLQAALVLNYCTKEVYGMLVHSDADIFLYGYTGDEARSYALQIATIRLELFRDFPYLYVGTIEDEYEYLSMYFNSRSSHLVLGFNSQNQLICYSSSIAVDDCTDDIKTPSMSLGYKKILYIGEVMIRPEYRLRGLSRHCMNYHDRKAREGGYDAVMLMSIDRPYDHPYTPAGYRSLDSLWIKYGYQRVTSASIVQSWRQIDTDGSVLHQLGLWIKPISSTSDH